MSAVLPRAAVDFIVHSEKAQHFARFLKNVMLPDEKLWATLTGNPSELPVPGGFDARALYNKTIKDRPPPNPAFGADGAWNRMWAVQNSPVQDEPLYDAMEGDRQKRAKGMSLHKPTTEEPFALQDHWIGRYQIWWMNDVDKCRGMWRKDSCVFGVGDLPDLLASSQLVAHKLYLNFEPAAFFCLYENIRLRALDAEQQRFVGAAYARLPQVQLARGVNIINVQTYFGQMLG
ncbi:GLY-1 protein [Aphelenchoides avenae]|nr:GLY-1 protein [Aphelenchus avenae]